MLELRVAPIIQVILLFFYQILLPILPSADDIHVLVCLLVHLLAHTVGVAPRVDSDVVMVLVSIADEVILV